MWPLRKKSTPTLEATPERELVGLACGGSGAAFAEIMRRNNRRLFRTEELLEATGRPARSCRTPMSVRSGVSALSGKKPPLATALTFRNRMSNWSKP